MPEESVHWRRWILLTGVAVAGSITLSQATPANASAGSSKDPDTGLICITPQCDFLRSVDGSNVSCRKVWPDNDRRKKVQLRCSKKVERR